MNTANQKVQYYFASFSPVYKKANPTFFTFYFTKAVKCFLSDMEGMHMQKSKKL